MEWMLPVNEMLTDQITKLNCTLIPPGFHGDVRSVRVMIESLCKLIDSLGEQSAKAQGLNKVITTAEKLRNSPTNILYLLKDTKAKNGKGDVIGLLKVGHKHLFLFDEKDKVREVEPLCVLDFFVLPDRQRHGYGRVLFDHMLHDLETSPQELAIDGPSSKMEQFLCKNYGIDRLVRQNNNFAISPQFFSAVPDINKSGRSTPVVTPAVGRFAAPKPPSAIANVIHGDHCQEANGYIRSAIKDFNDRVKIRETSESGSPSGHPENDVHEANNKCEPEPEEPSKAMEVTVEELVENQKSPERPSTLKVEPMVEAPPPEPSPAGSTASRRDSQLTDRGYFDVKFYHNKLW